MNHSIKLLQNHSEPHLECVMALDMIEATSFLLLLFLSLKLVHFPRFLQIVLPKYAAIEC